MSSHLLSILNSLPHPTLAVDKRNIVVGINHAAKEIFGVTDSDNVEISFGRLLHCDNVLSKGICGTGIMCRSCSVNDMFKLAFETRQVYKKQIAIVHTHKNTGKYIWRVSFSIGYASYLDDGYAIISISNALLEENPDSLAKPSRFIDGQIDDNESEACNEDTLLCHQDIGSNVAFRKVEALLNSLFPNVDEGLIVVEASGYVAGCNAKMSGLFGASLNVGSDQLNLWELIETADETVKKIDISNTAFRSDDGPYTFDGAVVTKQGTRVPASFTLAPLSDYLDRSQGWIIIVKDLSVEILLRAQVEKNNFVIENAPNDYIFCDVHGFVTYANMQARGSYGWDKGNAQFANITEILVVSGVMKWNRLMRSIIKRGAIQLETKHRNKMGEVYPVMASVYVIHDKPQNSLCYMAYNHSAHKNTQDRLLKEVKINQNMAEISKLLSNVDKFGTVLLLVRQYALEITESQFCFLAYRNPLNNELVTSIYSDSSYSYQEEVEMLERHFRECYLKHHDEKMCHFANQDLNDYLVGDIPIYQLLPFNKMAWAAIEIDNDYKGVLFVAGKRTEYSSADGQTLKNLSTLFGLAINRIQEYSLTKNSNEKLLMAMDVANLGTFEWNLEKRTVEVSQLWLEMLGYGNHSTLVEIPEIIRLVHSCDVKLCFRDFITHLRYKTPQFRFVSRIKNAKGEYQWIQSIGKVVTYSHGGRPIKVISVHFDITEQMVLNQRLVKTKEEAVSASKAKSVFIARMSHELRTPLNAITGFSDLLKNNTTDEIQLGYLNSIKKSGMALLDLINDLLDFSKIEAGKLSLRPSEVDVVQLMRETVFMFKAPAEEKFLQLKLKLPGNPPTERIWIDDTRLRQVLSNLIGNAIKFTEKGHVEVIVETSPNPDGTLFLSISVIDTGIGVKPESQKTIFDDFVQQDGQDNRRYGGTGLGLGIVKRLVELMEGSITLDSQSGVGSHFKVDLPKCKVVVSRYENAGNLFVGDVFDHETFKLPSNNGFAVVEIEQNIKVECQLALAKLWPSFRDAPSFSKIPPIVGVLIELGTKLQVGELLQFAKRLQSCYNNFNVEELKKCIVDLEKFADLYELV
ncbi:MAG: ATP-binding protein [Breznakibacter sp.]